MQLMIDDWFWWKMKCRSTAEVAAEIESEFSLSTVNPTFPPPGWYLMLSMEPILERTFFRSGVGALMEREFLGARGTGGFFSSGVCLGTGGLVMTRRRCAASPLVEAAGVAGVMVETGRRAGGRRRSVVGNNIWWFFCQELWHYTVNWLYQEVHSGPLQQNVRLKQDMPLCKVLMATFHYGAIKIT